MAYIDPWSGMNQGTETLAKVANIVESKRRQDELDAMQQQKFGLEMREGLRKERENKIIGQTLKDASNPIDAPNPEYDAGTPYYDLQGGKPVRNAGQPVGSPIISRLPTRDEQYDRTYQGLTKAGLGADTLKTALGDAKAVNDLAPETLASARRSTSQKALLDHMKTIGDFKKMGKTIGQATIKSLAELMRGTDPSLSPEQALVEAQSVVDGIKTKANGDTIIPHPYTKEPMGVLISRDDDKGGTYNHFVPIKDEKEKEYKTSSAPVREGLGEKQTVHIYDFNTADQRKKYEELVAAGKTVDQAAQAVGGSMRQVKSYTPPSQNSFRMEIPVPVLDTNNGNAVGFASRRQISEDIKQGGNRFLPSTGAASEKALNKENLMQDIKDASASTRASLNKLTSDFDAKQRAQFSYVLKTKDSKSALSTFLGSSVGQTLKPDQVDYITDIVQLKENAMAMRSILGAGQGSDEMREAISATIPGASTADKAYAKKQLDKFDAQLGRLSRGIPKVPLRSDTMPKTAGQPETQVYGGGEKALTVVNTGTIHGRKVNKMSDGSVRYAE